MNHNDVENLPTDNTLRKMIQRKRTSANIGAETLNTINYILPQNLVSLDENESFLKEDKWFSDNIRYTIFTSNKLLQALCASDVIVVDGTFGTVPNFMYQLITVHVEMKSRDTTCYVPVVFTLVNSKRAEVYLDIFKELIKMCGKIGAALSPKIALCDFEQGLIIGLRGALNNVEVKLCFFHLRKSILR